MVPAIDVDGLHVSYKGKRGRVSAVRGLSFTVEPGEVVGFLGPNGAGKSSTLKALMGFVRADQGRCELFGLPAGSVEAKRLIGYLPEVALYYPHLTPLETLTLYGELQGLGGKALAAQCQELLAEVGLASASRKLNKQLSKGMLQRVGIAQALLGEPKLLILDEVTSGLDPLGRQELRSLLKARQAAGCTLFFSSHELAEVELLCDRILVIHEGRLIDRRDMPGLKAELRRYALKFAGQADMSGLSEDFSGGLGERVAHFESKDQLVEAIARVTQAKGIVLDVIAQDAPLEDYFVQTIRRAA